MVGEIRDLETAEIAVQASLTGHLVLSTLHTNTAIGAVTRLQDMGVEPFPPVVEPDRGHGAAPGAPAVPECREPASPRSRNANCWIWQHRSGPRCTARRLPACNGSGYRGRTGIYELIEVDDTLRALIHDGASEQAMTARARSRYPSIQAHGRERILRGDTSLQEVLRVTAIA
jgi:general secretion pathway protein E